MRRRTRIWLAGVAVLAALGLPAAASAHAYLVKTVPAASVEVNTPPPDVELTYDEAVEPRLAIVSVTDVRGHSVTDGPVTRSPGNPDTLVVPLKRVPTGWYLVYWRVISVDGHPVQSAFSFSVGPNPGPVPQFQVPHIAGTATSTPLVIAKWLAFLTLMTAIGLFALRMLIAQPLVRRVEGTSLRGLSIAFGIVAALGLVAVPVYIEDSTATDSLHSFFDLGAVVPLWRATAANRGWVDIEICFALFCAAAAIAIRIDRPRREGRSVAALLALSGALAAAAATLLLPGTVGHAGQTAPRGLAVVLDWLHLVSGSIWIGGLLGLLVVWATLPAARRVAGLAVCVPRFSNVAFFSVLLLLGTGVGASILHLPTLDALWLTSWGKAVLVKSGILLAAMLLASVNLLKTTPGLSRPEEGEGSARLLRGLVGGEAVLVAGAVLVAAVLSSLAPPPPAFAQESSALARVGPGKVAETVTSDGYVLQVLVDPNKAVRPNSFALRLTRDGKPVTGADVTLNFAMLDMQMPSLEYQLAETAPGVYSHKASALVMVGHWGLTFNVTPKGGQPFSAVVVDHATG
ncbi:MAG TPA: copper resistance protein CopC [Gaiellaceae bacterium]|nr:copper resistance protein CopC [Gaiellaceae bacterium]